MDRPIIFSGPMVRALWEGRKTQTRRLLYGLRKGDTKAQMRAMHDRRYDPPMLPLADHLAGKYYDLRHVIEIGGRIWVRENWRVNGLFDGLKPSELEVGQNLPGLPKHPAVFYEATPDPVWMVSDKGKLRPSIFLPRWASRMTLPVTAVKIERLQDISEEDAVAEGYPSPEQRAQGGVAEIRDAYPIAWYSWLWDSINGAGSWEANPWVAAYTFTVERRNIDTPSDRREGL